MKVALLSEPLKFQVTEEAMPEPGPGEVRIQVKAAGICGTDLEAFSGRTPRGWSITYPFRMGHELAGVVDKVGPNVTSLKVGDRVVPDGRLVCGQCYYCRQGKFSACKNAGYTSGGFMEYSVYPAKNLVVIPEGVSFFEAALTEPLSCCINGESKLSVAPGDTAAVIGDGPIGILHAQLLKARGAKVVLIGMVPERLDLALQLGIDAAINIEEKDPVKEVDLFTQGCGADVVVVAVASGAVLEQAFHMAGRFGQVLYFAATMKPKLEIDLDLVHYKELKLVGSYDSTIAHFEKGLQLLAQGLINVKSLVSHRFSLEEINEAFETARQRKGLKIIIEPGRKTQG